jgi:hypothetical protein
MTWFCVNAARGWRVEAVEHCQFAMIQIRQPKHSATVIPRQIVGQAYDKNTGNTIGFLPTPD